MIDDPQIVSALISAVGSLITAVVTAVVALVIGKKFARVAKLKAQLSTAARDIEFLLEVERHHTNLHRERDAKSMLLTVRRLAKSNGYSWSGQFIPSRTKRFTLETSQ